MLTDSPVSLCPNHHHFPVPGLNYPCAPYKRGLFYLHGLMVLFLFLCPPFDHNNVTDPNPVLVGICQYCHNIFIAISMTLAKKTSVTQISNCFGLELLYNV